MDRIWREGILQLRIFSIVGVGLLAYSPFAEDSWGPIVGAIILGSFALVYLAHGARFK